MPPRHAGPRADSRRAWLVARLGRLPHEPGAASLVADAARLLGIATGDAVSVRALSRDRTALVPLAAEHPDPDFGVEMLAIMRRTAASSDSGLWRAVLSTREPQRWSTAAAPEVASGPQADFIVRFSVRSILGVPVTTEDDALVGGLSLVRLFDDRPFTDEDEALARVTADRLAGAVERARD